MRGAVCERGTLIVDGQLVAGSSPAYHDQMLVLGVAFCLTSDAHLMILAESAVHAAMDKNGRLRANKYQKQLQRTTLPFSFRPTTRADDDDTLYQAAFASG